MGGGRGGKGEGVELPECLLSSCGLDQWRHPLAFGVTGLLEGLLTRNGGHGEAAHVLSPLACSDSSLGVKARARDMGNNKQSQEFPELRGPERPCKLCV